MICVYKGPESHRKLNASGDTRDTRPFWGSTRLLESLLLSALQLSFSN